MLPALKHLLNHYFLVVDELLAAATPQESTLISLGRDARYEKALQGLRLVAKHELTHLMQSLLSWRAAGVEDLRSRANSSDYELRMKGRAAKVVLECLFMEPTMQLLEELTPPPVTISRVSGAASAATAVLAASAPGVTGVNMTGSVTTPAKIPGPPQVLTTEHVKFCTNVQEICFYWLINMDDLLPAPDLPSFRQHMTIIAQRTIGAVSCVSLPLIGNPLIQTLRKLVNPEKGNKTHPDILRAQTLRLCSGMQNVTFTFNTEEQLRNVVAFLDGVFPFSYTAAIKKSQVHHALGDMITKMLAPLVLSGQPYMCDWLCGWGMSGIMEWYAMISKYKDAVWSWMQKHDKHIRVGWLFGTVLVCLLDSDKYTTAREIAVDFLLKQLKNKEYRGLVVRCLVLLITSLLVRFGKAQAMPRPELVKLLDKVVRGPASSKDAPCLLSTARKGYLNKDEIKEMLNPWAELAPDYVLGVLMELMGCDFPDCLLAALQTAHDMLSNAPPAAATLLQGDTPAPTPSVGGRPRVKAPNGGPASGLGPAAADMMELMRAGYHPIDLLGLGNLMSRFTAGLAKPWQAWHAMYGSPSAVLNPDNQRERALALSQFRWLLRLVPYTRPEVWVGIKPLDMMPGYLSHPELSAVAAHVLEEVVRSSPHLRNQVLVGVALHCSSLSDDNTKALREGLIFLKTLIEVWITCVKARAAGEVEERSTPEAGLVDLHRLEGTVWAAGLCCNEETVREQAIQVLEMLRTLHMALLASPAYQPVPTPALLATHLSCMAPWPTSGSGALMSASTLGQGGASGFQAGDAGGDLGVTIARSKSATAGQGNASGHGSGGRTSGSGPGVGAATAPAKPGHAHKNSQASINSSQDGNTVDGQGVNNVSGLIDYQDPDVTYMFDVLEQSGPDIIRASYWDWGDVSDLWSQYMDPPLVLSKCQELLASPCRDGDAKLRLTRLMIELAKTMALVSPVTSAAALHELCVGRLWRLAFRDRETGRMGLPQDTEVGVRRAEAFRYSGAVAAVLPNALRDTLAPAFTSALPLAAASIPFSTSSSSLNMFGTSSTPSNAAARAAASKPPGGGPQGLSMRDVMRCHMALAFPGASSPSLQASSIMAMGHANPAHHEFVLDEITWLLEECSGSKAPRKGTLLGLILTGSEAGEYSNRGGVTAGRSRVDEARRVVAHIMRLLAVNTPPELITAKAYRQNLRWRLQDWLSSTWLTLKDARPSGDLLWDNVQIAYCFASVINRVAVPLCDSLNQSSVLVKDPIARPSGAATSAPSLRKAIYDTLSAWTADGQQLEKDYKQFARAGIRNTVDKYRAEQEGATRGQADQERELRLWAGALDHRARSAMAAMLAGPVFDADSRRSQGPVLSWIDRLLRHNPSASSLGSPTAANNASQSPGAGNSSSGNMGAEAGSVPGAPRGEIGRIALLNLLQSNLDMFFVYLDKSYDAHHMVASTYFQALCEVYCTTDVSCAPHILVSLILYKMVDPMTEVREDARHLLCVLAQRVWGSPPLAMLPSPPLNAGPAHAALVGMTSPRRLHGRPSSGGGHGAPRISKAGSEGNPAPGGPNTRGGAAGGGGARISAPNTHPPNSGLQSAPTPSTPRGDTGGGVRVDLGATLRAQAGETAGGDETALGAWLPPDGGAAFSTLLDTYQENQHNMSELLASTHPELSEELCEEMMTRALECSEPSIQQPVLNSLTPWMNILIIMPQWKGSWCERLLKSMYYVTQRHGGSCPYEIQTLWCTLAAREDNVRHMLLFLVDMGMAAGQQDMSTLEAYLAVAKRICLYLARTHPQFTIDQLQTEVSKQIQEIDTTPTKSSQPVEFETLLGDLSTSELSTNGLAVAPTGLDPGWAAPSMDSSATTSYDLKGGMPADWRPGGTGQQGTDAASGRTTRSVEGGLMQNAAQQVAPRTGSGTSSRSSTAISSLNDSALGLSNKQTAGLPIPRTDEVTRSLPQVTFSAVSGGGAGVGGDVTPSAAGAEATRGVRESWTSLHGGNASQGMRGSMETSGGGVALQGAGEGTAVSGGAAVPGSMRSMASMGRSTGGGRALISRPELAMCLLSEVAFACDEEFMREGCLPLLLHACCVMLDAESPLVYTHAALLLTALVHSVGSYHQEQAQEKGMPVDMEQLHQLVRFLQSMRGKRMWACEDASCAVPEVPSYAALSGLVMATARALHWVDDLQAQWAAHAMDWALHCCSRHLSGRSFQVFRALSPPLDADLLATLLLCLHTCLDTSGANGPRMAGMASMGGGRPGDWGPRSGADCALEVLATLQSLVQQINPPSRLVLYPQVFWVGLSLLHSHVVALYSAGLALLSSYMRNLNLHQSKVLNVLLAAAPGLSGHILLHATAAKMGRNSDKGGLDGEVEEPESWALGAALLQLPSHDTSAQRHAPLAAQQLMLRGMQVATTLPATLHALADMAAVLEVQGAALNGSNALQDATNLPAGIPLDGREPLPGSTLGSMAPDGTLSGSGGPYDSLRKHRLLRLDAHQALLGPSHSQLFTTCLAVVLHALAVNNTSVTSVQVRPEPPAAQAALARCLTCLSRACDAHGLAPLVAPLQQAAHVWADSGTGVPLTYPPNVTKPSMSRLLLRQLCAGMAAAFLPCYGPLLLHHCLDSLAQVQTANKHLAVMQLLQALFTVLLESLEQQMQAARQGSYPGGADLDVMVLRLPPLGPVAMRLLTHPTLMSPLMEKTQGALATAATDALQAVVAYTAARRKWSSSGAPGGGTKASSLAGDAGSWAGASVSRSASGVSEVTRTLHPASVNTAAAIRRVIDTLGTSVWRGHRVTRLLPHLGSHLARHQQDA